MRKNNILVLGVGNWLMGDEGVGVHAVNLLQTKNLLHPSIEILDGGTGGFHLLGLFETYENIIVIDATMDGQPPGTIRVLQPKFASDYPNAMSAHDIGLKDLVSAIQLLGKQPKVHLVLVSIQSLDQQSVSLTPQIEKVLPLVAEEVKSIAEKIIAGE